METRGTWTDLIAGVGLEIGEVFNQAMETYQPGIFNVLNKKGGSGAQRNVTGKTGLGELKKFNDGDDLPGGRRYKTYTTKVVYNNYGEFVDVTKNTIEDRDEAYESDLNEVRDLTIAGNYSQDKAGMQLFNGGFATTTTVNGYEMTWYGDLKPLFSTIHPSVVPGASSQSNASATGLPYSYDNLETMEVAMIQQAEDDGKAMVMRGKIMVLVPTALKKEASESLDSQLDPTTANNAINVYRGNIDMATSLFLDTKFGGSDTAWYGVVQGGHKLNHEVRQDLRLEQAVNIKNKVLTNTIDARWADSATEWKRTWGSKGDGAAYSS